MSALFNLFLSPFRMFGLFKKKVDVKNQRIMYGFLENEPNESKIEKVVSNMLNKGYELKTRTDHAKRSSCLFFYVRGYTSLIFARRNKK